MKTFVDYIIKERSRKFLSISLMDMEKSNYKGTLEEWFSDMYIDYTILNQKEETPLCTPDNCRHGY